GGRPEVIPALRRLLGDPPELRDPAFESRDAAGNPELRAIMDRVALPWFRARPKLDVWLQTQAAGCISGPLNTMEDVFASPVYRERSFLLPQHTETLGDYEI